MSFTHTLTQGYATNVGTVATATLSFTGDAEDDLDVAVPASTTNQTYAMTINKTAVQSMLIYCDQSATIKTNSATSPQDTISLSAGVPVIWNTSSGATEPISGNVTSLYVTNSNSVTANLKIRVLESL
jgi:hypothetical protein